MITEINNESLFFSIQYSYFSNTGCHRKKNEDAVLVQNAVISDINMDIIESEIIIGLNFNFVVADGMGGEQHGEYASRVTLEYIKDHADKVFTRFELNDLLISCDMYLKEITSKDPIFNRSGTVIAGIFIRNDNLFIFNIGDCRVYRLNYEYFETISHDHSLVQTYVDQGGLNEDEMRYHQEKNIITSAITSYRSHENLEIFIDEKKLRDGDVFFICSDGIWETLSLDELEEIWEQFGPGGFSEKILQKCLEKDARDNISLILLVCKRVNN